MTDPKVAVALHYAWGEGTPMVTASGKGKLAARIVDEAVSHGVPVHADAQLAELLAKTPVGTAIPPAAFLAVAQLLSFLYDVDRLIATQASDGEA
ncbi:MAG: EscU/YscU/HrcU family type III secretion system export apparatus switch protein [Pseudomonadota bacterium]